MTLDLSEVKKIAVQCGFELVENESGQVFVEDKISDGNSLFNFAKAIYEMGAAEQKEKDAKICEELISGYGPPSGKVKRRCAQAIRSQEGR